MTDGEHPSAKQDLLSRLCSALISVCSFLQNASKNRLVTRVLTQQKTIYILFQAYPRMLGELSILLTRCANSDARYRTQPASKEHTVFHMYGTYILPYANMCCNCCCCQHPPSGCIICGVRSNLTSDPAKHLAYCLIGLQAFRPAIVYCRNTCLTTSIFGICSGSLPIPPIYTVLTETRRASMSSAAEHRSLNYYG